MSLLHDPSRALPSPRRRAVRILIFAAFLFALGLFAFWDSFHRPRPIVLDLSHDRDLPSALPYTGRYVRIYGTVDETAAGVYALRSTKADSWRTPDPWFKDAPNTMHLVLPRNVPDGAIGSFEGRLTVTPPVPGSHGQESLSLVVDRMDYTACEGGYTTPVSFSLREHLDTLLTRVLVIVILLTPLWLRYTVQAFFPGRKASRQHRCPCCGYDCRGTPNRCPECGTRVEPPNYRLDLRIARLNEFATDQSLNARTPRIPRSMTCDSVIFLSLAYSEAARSNFGCSPKG